MPELIDRIELRKDFCNMCEAMQPEMIDCEKKGCMSMQIINDQPTIEAEPVRKPEMSEADRKKCEEWCKDCEHIEMCKWYPFGGCDFRLLPKPEQSTIEPKVRHGRWIEGTSRGSYSIYCSCCGSHKETICPTDYCPNCGARMDGGADNGFD